MQEQMRKLVEQSGKKKNKKKKLDKPRSRTNLNNREQIMTGHSAMKELMKASGSGMRGVSDSIGTSLANVSLGAGS